MREARPENPPFMMVNTHPSFVTGPKTSPAIGESVAPVGEIADERRLQHHMRIDSAMKGKEVRKPNRGQAKTSLRGALMSHCLSGACPISGKTTFIPVTTCGRKRCGGANEQT